MTSCKLPLTLSAVFLTALLSAHTVPEEKPSVRHNPWSLIIYRPENSPGMNEVRCRLRLTDAETGEDVTYTKAKANYSWISRPNEGIPYQRTYYLSGGMAMHLLLKPGRYRISFCTMENRQSGSASAEPEHRISNEFFYDTENPAKVIFVSPTANENGFYDGGWFVSAKAPRYFQFTVPKTGSGRSY